MMTQKNIKTKGAIKMKKIGIAIFSLMFAGVAYVGAQDMKFDFDGEIAVQNDQAMEKFSMPEAFSDIEYNIPVPKREVKYDIENNTQSTYKGVTKEMLDNSIKSAIEDCKKNKFNILENNFNNLLKIGTVKEKQEFVYGSNKNYSFPKRIVKLEGEKNKLNILEFVRVGGCHETCVASHTEQQCSNRQVCHNVCHAGQIVCHMVGVVGGIPPLHQVCSAGAPVCHLVCEIIPECSNVTICDEWKTECW